MQGENCGGPWQRPCEFVPTPVSTTLRFRTLSVGGEHGEYACGIAEAGEAYCWGRADAGGAGTEPRDSVCLPYGCYARPTRIGGSVPFASITTGDSHACALDREGRAYCWGSGAAGQLGNEPTERCPDLHLTIACSRTPVPVQGDLTFTALTAGAVHTCGLTRDHQAYCWGANNQGQLGTEAPLANCSSGHVGLPCTMRPAPVAGMLRFRQISAHGDHTCALTPEGAASCWGEGRYGQLGQGVVETEWPYGERSTPVRVLGNVSYVELSAWGVCGRTAAGELYCWGIHSPDRDITAPARMPGPPDRPLLLSFTPRPAAVQLPPRFRITTEDARIRIEGHGPAVCANHTFHAAATRHEQELELWVIAGRWEGGGCDPSDANFVYEAVLGGLEAGRYRLRILHHFKDDRGQVRRDWMADEQVEVGNP